ncbi:hypothetical protein ACP70R_026976 [Stipagrostis hirtigluma subsp. patula]
MRSRLQVAFTKSQLVEKIKYRNCVDRLRVSSNSFSFRSPHEQAIFEIPRTIRRPASDKHGRESDGEGNGANNALAIDAAAAAAAAAVASANTNGEVKPPSSRQHCGHRRHTSDFATDAGKVLALPPVPMPVMIHQEALPSSRLTAMDGSITIDPAALLSVAVAGNTTATLPPSWPAVPCCRRSRPRRVQPRPPSLSPIASRCHSPPRRSRRRRCPPPSPSGS